MGGFQSFGFNIAAAPWDLPIGSKIESQNALDEVCDWLQQKCGEIFGLESLKGSGHKIEHVAFKEQLKDKIEAKHE